MQQNSVNTTILTELCINAYVLVLTVSYKSNEWIENIKKLHPI